VLCEVCSSSNFEVGEIFHFSNGQNNHSRSLDDDKSNPLGNPLIFMGASLLASLIVSASLHFYHGNSVYKSNEDVLPSNEEEMKEVIPGYLPEPRHPNFSLRIVNLNIWCMVLLFLTLAVTILLNKPMWYAIKGQDFFLSEINILDFLNPIIILTIWSLNHIYHSRLYKRCELGISEKDEEDTEKIFHCIAILSCGEDLKTFHDCIRSICKTESKSAILLFLGFEWNNKRNDSMTVDHEKKIKLAQRYSKSFEAIILCNHILDKKTEVVGACANVHHVQQCAVSYIFRNNIDPENCLFTKVDCNTIFIDDFFKEVDEHWYRIPKEERESKLFLPIVHPGAKMSDSNRTLFHILSANQQLLGVDSTRFFSFSTVCMSLKGIMKAYLTNPAITAEDQLTPWKVRVTSEATPGDIFLNSIILKVFPSPDSACDWKQTWEKKAIRWDQGGVENFAYMVNWYAGNFGESHPKIRNVCAGIFQMCMEFLRISTIIIGPHLILSLFYGIYMIFAGVDVFPQTMMYIVSFLLFWFNCMNALVIYRSYSRIPHLEIHFFKTIFLATLLQPVTLIWRMYVTILAWYRGIMDGKVKWDITQADGQMVRNRGSSSSMSTSAPDSAASEQSLSSSSDQSSDTDDDSLDSSKGSQAVNPDRRPSDLNSIIP